MSIKEIRSYLNTFTCEVLTDSASDMSDIQDFICDIRNNTLEEYLHNDAINDSKNGLNKVFIIRDEERKIAAFFSLRCGMALELNPLDEEYEQLSETQKIYVRDLFEARKNPNNMYYYELLKHGEKLFPSVIGDLQKIVERNKKIESDRINTGESEGAILYVENCHPAIEIQHFCRNTAYTSTKLVKGKIGFGLFWEVIVPKIMEISSEIGAEYLYLFAADKSDNEEDEKLVTYYRDALTFNPCDFNGVSLPRPKDDLNCCGLIQPIDALESMKEFAWAEHEDYFEEKK